MKSILRFEPKINMTGIAIISPVVTISMANQQLFFTVRAILNKFLGLTNNFRINFFNSVRQIKPQYQVTPNFLYPTYFKFRNFYSYIHHKSFQVSRAQYQTENKIVNESLLIGIGSI